MYPLFIYKDAGEKNPDAERLFRPKNAILRSSTPQKSKTPFFRPSEAFKFQNFFGILKGCENLSLNLIEIPCKWLYRLESVSPHNGLWYDADGRFVWGIGKLPHCKTKDLPMDYDARYHKDGKSWFSSCSNKEDLLHWYSVQDALDLVNNGFVFTRYLATKFVEYKKETTFIKGTCLRREELDIEDLFRDDTKMIGG